MKIAYRGIHLSKTNKVRLALINAIIEEYQKDGYVLTLRQLYYQLVTRDVIPNSDKEYKKLGELLKEGRMAGIVDWDAIEDRLRTVEKPLSFEDPEHRLRSAIYNYDLDRQKGQPIYLECWVEKDALSGVLERVTRPYHVPIMVNRGYSSASAMHDAFNRFKEAKENGQKVEILYFGDHDPSGLNMVKDIRNRIEEFATGIGLALPFKITPIALTMTQIKLYNPPPNPAKVTDSRYVEYEAEHGTESWEVDALPPDVLNELLENAITSRIDMEKYRTISEQVEIDRARLMALKDHL